jgi:hypothetical protein
VFTEVFFARLLLLLELLFRLDFLGTALRVPFLARATRFFAVLPVELF